MMRKLFIPIFVFSAALCFAGCVEEHNDLEDGGSSGGGTSQGGGSSSSGSGSSDKTYNFWTDDCATMGGQKLSSGACYIPCSSDNDCKNIIGARRCGGFCYSDDTSCADKPGWIMNEGRYSCVLLCNGQNDTSTCPSGYKCVNDGLKDTNGVSHYNCSRYTSSSGGGGGYCKQLGCGGIFCSGKCIGCPGC